MRRTDVNASRTCAAFPSSVARVAACAVSMCHELGVKKIAIPSAGNAASALAAYAAPRGSRRTSSCRSDVPQSNFIECKAYGAHVTLVDGLISDCGRDGGGAQSSRGLVRDQHAEGALPDRRQEDDGL